MGCILIEYLEILYSRVSWWQQMKETVHTDKIAAVMLKPNVIWCIKYMTVKGKLCKISSDLTLMAAFFFCFLRYICCFLKVNNTVSKVLFV